MKKLLTFLLLFVATTSVMAQDTDTADEQPVMQKPIILPGAGKINVESLNKFKNYGMDISKLSLAELRVLRNAIPARKGYIFMAGDLRSIFNTTTWYDSLMWKHFSADEDTEGYGWQEDGSYKSLPIKYTPVESKFMAKLKAREDQLLKENFKITGDNRVNVANIINPWQVENMAPQLEN